MTPPPDNDLKGWIYAIAAFGWWGCVFPFLLLELNAQAAPYFDSKIAWSLEILVSRIVWCFVVCIGLVLLTGRAAQFRAVFTSRRTFITLAITALLIACNWFSFIVGAAVGRLSEISLGYYINPLLNVLLGYLFLGEHLRRVQSVAVLLAGIGVAWLVVIHGDVPWLALIVATSFGCYGLLRKRLNVDALIGMTFESLFCLPVALAYLAYRFAFPPELAMAAGNPALIALLVACGPATAAPLIWFAAGARRLRLSTMGFIQFLAPTGQLVIALWANNETLTPTRLGGFVFIWIAVAIYLWDIARVNRRSEPVELPVACTAQ